MSVVALHAVHVYRKVSVTPLAMDCALESTRAMPEIDTTVTAPVMPVPVTCRPHTRWLSTLPLRKVAPLRTVQQDQVA